MYRQINNHPCAFRIVRINLNLSVESFHDETAEIQSQPIAQNESIKFRKTVEYLFLFFFRDTATAIGDTDTYLVLRKIDLIPNRNNTLYFYHFYIV